MSFFPSLLYCIPKGIDIISGLPVKRLTRCEYAGKKRVQWLSSLHISQGEASTHSHSQTRPQRIRTSNQNDAPNESIPLYSKPSPSGFIPLVKSRPQRIHTNKFKPKGICSSSNSVPTQTIGWFTLRQLNRSKRLREYHFWGMFRVHIFGLICISFRN